MHFVRRPALVLSVVALATLGGCASRADVPPVAATEAEPPPPTAEARGWYLRAQVAEGRGDLQEAERALQWLTRKDGRRAVTHDHLARFYMRHRRWDDARGAWLQSLERDPERWEPHTGLAMLDKRAGDASGERAHLERAVLLGADAATHEWLVRLLLDEAYVAAPDGAEPDLEPALRIFARWEALPLTDPVDRLHRGRMAWRLDRPDTTLDDLVYVADVAPDRARDVVERLVDAADASCRYRTAWTWARGANLGDPFVRREVAELAAQVGDPSLLERTLDLDGVGPAPDGLPRLVEPALDLPVPEDDAIARTALMWLRAGRPERTLELTALRPADDWANLVAALAHLSLVRDDEAERALSTLDRDHPAWTWGQVLLLGMGRLEPAALQTWLDANPSHQADVARAAALLHHLPGMRTDLVQVKGLRLHDEAPPAPDEVIRLPAEHAGSLDSAVTADALADALEGGHRAEARRLAREWTARQPADPVAWLALAQADPAALESSLDRVTALDRCNEDAMLLRARHAPADEEDPWLRRAAEADPLSPAVQRALSQRGLGRDLGPR